MWISLWKFRRFSRIRASYIDHLNGPTDKCRHYSTSRLIITEAEALEMKFEVGVETENIVDEQVARWTRSSAFDEIWNIYL